MNNENGEMLLHTVDAMRDSICDQIYRSDIDEDQKRRNIESALLTGAEICLHLAFKAFVLRLQIPSAN